MLHTIQVETEQWGYPSITAQVADIVKASGVRDGFCVVSVPHTTAGLCITSFWDKRGLDDLVDELGRSFPSRVSYRNQASPFAASGQVKSAFIGTSTLLLVQNGRLVLGASQGLVLLEFDGPRKRECLVQVVEKPLFTRQCAVDTAYMGMHDITQQVQGAVDASGVNAGLCHVSMLHSTAGLLCCAREAAAGVDIMADIERMVPTRVDFKHRETASDAGGHVKTAFAGSQLSLAVQAGRLLLGEEEAILFAEFDGPRPRGFTVGVLAGA